MGFHFSVLEVARDLWQSVIFGSSFRIVDGTSWIHWDGKRFFDAVFISTENCATLAVTISSIRGILVTLWVLDQTLTCFGEYMVSTQPPLPVGLGSDVPPVHCSAGPFAGPQQQSWIRKGRLPQPDFETSQDVWSQFSLSETRAPPKSNALSNISALRWAILGLYSTYPISRHAHSFSQNPVGVEHVLWDP